MSMKILIFEDTSYKDLYPLNMLRGTYDIKCGANTILERYESILASKFDISLHCRNILAAYMKEIHTKEINSISKDDYLLLNGKVIFSEDSLTKLISKKKKNSYYVFNNEPVAAYITKSNAGILKERVESIVVSGNLNLFDIEFFEKSGFIKIDVSDTEGIKVINYSWDIIGHLLNNGLEDDIECFLKAKQAKKFKRIKNSESFINEKAILVSDNVNVYPDVILDASGGKILIGENNVIEPFTFIKGPVFIGKNVTIKSGTKIYGPCVIGEHSKVAGEIAESVLHSYVNKQHDGFIGHSYICPFVNLGADTVTSDLNNNYSKIKIRLNGNEIETGMQFLGSIIGDHTKTSINTMLNTGTISGIFANIFGSGFPPKILRSFSWNESGRKSTAYELVKAVETAKIVMKRRGIDMNAEYAKLMGYYSKGG